MKEYILYKKHTTVSAMTTELHACTACMAGSSFVQEFDKIKKVDHMVVK